MFTPEDEQCAKMLVNLRNGERVPDAAYEDRNTTDSDDEYWQKRKKQYIDRALEYLNKTTSPWNLKWSVNGNSRNSDPDEQDKLNELDELDEQDELDELDEHSTLIVFKTHIEWPTQHIIPFDLMPRLMENIKELSATLVERVEFHSDGTSVEFRCQHTFDDDPFSVTCESCGNRWDGNAQCPCYLNNPRATIGSCMYSPFF